MTRYKIFITIKTDSFNVLFLEKFAEVSGGGIGGIGSTFTSRLTSIAIGLFACLALNN